MPAGPLPADRYSLRCAAGRRGYRGCGAGCVHRSSIARRQPAPIRQAGQPDPGFPPRIVSPEVHADGTATFRLRAPAARQVVLTVDGHSPLPMTRQEDGVWTATSPVLEPDWYGYSFQVDGAGMLDPSAATIKTGEFGGQSLVQIPGNADTIRDEHDVPHGEIHHDFFKSDVTGAPSDYYVYTPPGYDPLGRQRYPVLYLLHGYSDDASAWTTTGQANFILDNLIAAGKARTMVVVMPLGYGNRAIISNGWAGLGAPGVMGSNNERFINSLLQEIIPRIESSYRVSSDRRSRAIAGLSMGGAESLSAGLNHPDRFGYVIGLSSALIMLRPELAGMMAPNAQASPANLDQGFNSAFPAVAPGLSPRPQLVWIACGRDDGLVNINRAFEGWLTRHYVQFTAVETPGAHTWFVWRRNLANFVPLLFR